MTSFQRLQQIIPSSTSSPTFLTPGISDYIPLCLKSKPCLSICVQGQCIQVINGILWNEFYSKGLVKQCKHHLQMGVWSIEDHQKNNKQPIFVKTNKGKIHKLQQCLQWECQLRKQLLKDSKGGQGELLIQGFSFNGKIKQIIITFGYYSVKRDTDLILKMVTKPHKRKQQPEESCKNKKNHKHASIKDSTDSDKSMPRKRANTSNGTKNQSRKVMTSKNFNAVRPEGPTKYSTMTTIENKANYLKQSIHSSSRQGINKENNFPRTEYKREEPGQQVPQRVVYSSQNTFSLSNACNKAINDTIVGKVTSNELSLPEPNLNTSVPGKDRQIVLSKILQGKQEIILTLKGQLQNQQKHFLELLQEQKASRQEQVQTVTKNVKNILSQYQVLQRDQIAENRYLKQRVKMLEDALVRAQSSSEQLLAQKQTIFTANRDNEETIKHLTHASKAQKEQYQNQLQMLRSEHAKRVQEVKRLMQKCSQTELKYEKIVKVMKQSLPQD